MAARWPANFYIFLLLFVSIGGAVELARSRNKVHGKKRKISISRNFCSVIYTYSTVLQQGYLMVSVQLFQGEDIPVAKHVRFVDSQNMLMALSVRQR